MRGVIILRKRLRKLVDVGQIALGHVTKTSDGNVKTVKVINMELDNKYLMYFNRSIMVNCEDKRNISKNGDIVLIQRLETPTHLFRKYNVEEVIHKLGEQSDPFANDSYLNVLKNLKASEILK
jgi:hypothetical protein